MTATPTLLPASSRRTRLWGPAMIAGLAAALAGGVALRSLQVNEPAFTATLTAPVTAGGGALFKARLEPRRHRVMLTPLSPAAARSRLRARQLWLTPQGGFPHSAGLIDPSRTSPLRLSPVLLRAAGPRATLGVTMEPAGGSPTGLPSGPMIAEGALSGG